jgi:hypothetical protein
MGWGFLIFGLLLIYIAANNLYGTMKRCSPENIKDNLLLKLSCDFTKGVTYVGIGILFFIGAIFVILSFFRGGQSPPKVNNKNTLPPLAPQGGSRRRRA